MFFLIYFSNSIDATDDDGSIGRLVNDSRYYPNSVMKKITVNGIHHLCLFATRDIDKDEEIMYWYGEFSFLTCTVIISMISTLAMKLLNITFHLLLISSFEILMY